MGGMVVFDEINSSQYKTGQFLEEYMYPPRYAQILKTKFR